jgi:hypothetical protein
MFRKNKLACTATVCLAMAAMIVSSVSPASAWCRWGCGGWGWGGPFVGAAVAGAVVGGALAAPYYAPYYYGPGYRCWRRDYYGRPYRVC